MLGTEKLYTAAQTRALDHCAIHNHSIPGIVLMARAAEVAFSYLLEVSSVANRCLDHYLLSAIDSC